MYPALFIHLFFEKHSKLGFESDQLLPIRWVLIYILETEVVEAVEVALKSISQLISEY